MNRQRLLLRARDMGLAEIKLETAAWGLTSDGRDFLDLLDLLRELDDRPGGARASSPRRQAQPARPSRAATPSTGTRRGDDDPARRRGAEGKASA